MMKKEGTGKRIGIVLVIGVLIVIGMRLIHYFRIIRELASVGIIGGSDGPTAIYLTCHVSPIHGIMIAMIVIAAVIGAVLLFNKRKK